MKNIIYAYSIGLLIINSAFADNVQFRYPLQINSAHPDYVTRYFGLDKNRKQDWNLGYYTGVNDQLEYPQGLGPDSGTDFGVKDKDRVVNLRRRVVAAADGVVYQTIDDYPIRGGSFGNQVRIEHRDGTVSIYAHLASVNADIKINPEVKCGQVIGIAGATATGAEHLHFEVWSDRFATKKIDPFKGPGSNSASSYWVEQGEYASKGDPYHVPGAYCEDDLNRYEPNDMIETAKPLEIVPLNPIQSYDIQQHFLKQTPDGDIDVIRIDNDQLRRIGIDVVNLPEGITLTLSNDVSTIEVAETTNEVGALIEFDRVLEPGTYYITVNRSQKVLYRNHRYTIRAFELGSCSLASKSFGANAGEFTTQAFNASDCEENRPRPSAIAPSGNIGTLQPQFTWSNVYGATAYDIFVYRQGSTTSELVFVREGVIGRTFVMPNGVLLNDRRYSWTVRAVFSDNSKSAVSNKAFFITDIDDPQIDSLLDPPRPLAPGSVIILDIDTTTPTLYWQKELGASKYGLFVADSAGRVVYENLNISGANSSHSLPVGLLDNDRDYQWYMISIDDNGYRSNYSYSLLFTTKTSISEVPHIKLDHVDIDDNDSGGSDGDSDQRAESGEKIELDVYLANVGGAKATKLKGTINESSTCLSVLDETGTRQKLQNGEIQKLTSFLLDVRACPDGTDIELRLDLDYEEGSDSFRFPITVYDNSISLADLKYKSHTIEDDDDHETANSNMAANAGEEFDLIVNIENDGDETADSVELSVSEESECISFNKTSVTRGQIAAGDSKSYQFLAFVPGDCEPQSIPIELRIESEKGQWGDSFSLEILENDLRPDFAFLTEPVLASSTVEAQEPINSSVEIINLGDLKYSDSVVRYLLSNDNLIERSDIELGSDEFERIEPNESGSASFSFNAPSIPGTYFLGACIDPAAGENVLNNNCSSSTQITVLEREEPDLMIVSTSISDNSAIPREYIDHTIRVRNIGSVAARPTEVELYISTNKSNLYEQEPYGDSNVDALSTSEETIVTTDRPVPNELGLYWHGYCIKPVTNETFLSNNCSEPVAIRVVSRRYDLGILNQPVLIPSNPDANVLGDTRVLVTNVAGDRSDYDVIGFYLSETQEFGPSQRFLATDEIRFLRSGKSNWAEAEFLVPDVNGEYFLRACLIPSSTEFNESNNCSPSLQFYVGPKPSIESDEQLCFPVLAKNEKAVLVCL